MSDLVISGRLSYIRRDGVYFKIKTRKCCFFNNTGCPDKCSGKGRCINGTCKCINGWVGKSCNQGISSYFNAHIDFYHCILPPVVSLIVDSLLDLSYM